MTKEKDTLAEILEWSKDRPTWQRDALRRIFVAGKLTESDLVDLVVVCKSKHGLSDPMSPTPLAAEHLAIKSGNAKAVSMVSLTHHHGANALAVEQTVSFGQELTVVFGENATGKSGYTRILKQACRSRASEDILGDVLSGGAPLALDASIQFREGAEAAPSEWKSVGAVSGALASVSIFDAHCAPVYIREKTDVAFRPFGLDVFDSLSVACGRIKAQLEKEQVMITPPIAGLPVLPDNTKARTLLDGLTAFTKVADVSALADLSKTETARLQLLKQQRNDLQTADPSKLVKDIRLKAKRLESLAEHLRRLSEILGTEGVSRLRATFDSARAARKAVSVLQKSALAADLLPATGGKDWRAMWSAVKAFSGIAYPGSTFPVLTDGARCPFCQQTIGSDAAERVKHFAEYVASNAQTELNTAESAHAAAVKAISEQAVIRPDIEGVVAELAGDDQALSVRIQEHLESARTVQESLLKISEGSTSMHLDAGPSDEIGTIAKSLRERAASLDAQKSGMEPSAASELIELEARLLLADKTALIFLEIERKQKLRQYGDCIAETSTLAITKKSTELTTRLVTEQLTNAFQAELVRLEFKHLAIKLKPAGGAKGALYHQVVFANAPGVEVARVLSEGESRTLSLASFLAELSTAQTKSAIVFDDPVSSLDHA